MDTAPKGPEECKECAAERRARIKAEVSRVMSAPSGTQPDYARARRWPQCQHKPRQSEEGVLVELPTGRFDLTEEQIAQLPVLDLSGFPDPLDEQDWRNDVVMPRWPSEGIDDD